MMNRKMLIIANPGETGAENYCAGVHQDVVRYKNFFISNSGGAWDPKEIKTLIRPFSSQVDYALKELKTADYSIVVYCGHGYSRKSGTTMVELRTNNDYDSNNFNQGAHKHTVILDCCRATYEPIYESAQERYDLRDSIEHSIVRNQARARFDNAIQSCPSGLVVLYACSIGETAGDDEVKGGVYSHALRSAAIRWSRMTTGSGTASVVQIHNIATKIVCQETGSHQNPQIIKPRSSPYFPFCVAEEKTRYFYK